MAKKNPKAPTPQQVNLVLQQAASAPLQNLQHAKAVDESLRAMEAFFRGIYPAPEAPSNATA